MAALATVAGLVVAPGAVSPVPAAAATTWALEGYGCGHGWGMSQYGARGAAERGLSFRQILGFYYPGTKVGTASGNIRVLITAETRQALVVGHRSGLSVRSPSTGASYPLSRAGATRWRITPSADNATSKVWVYNGAWRLVRSIAGQAEFVAPSIRLYLPSGSKVYRGKLRSAIAGGQRDVVNVLSLESYLRGVVPLEMPALWEADAVRAQAVAARSYAAEERARGGHGHFDVYDTTSSQVYGGAGAEVAQSNAAIAATSGEIRTHDGAPARTQFSSSNGGWTVANPGYPYLVAKADPYDPLRRWTDHVTSAEIQAAWPVVGTVTGFSVTKRDGRGQYGGRAVTVTIKGTGRPGGYEVSGDSFRTRMGLCSSMFRKDV